MEREVGGKKEIGVLIGGMVVSRLEWGR